MTPTPMPHCPPLALPPLERPHAFEQVLADQWLLFDLKARVRDVDGWFNPMNQFTFYFLLRLQEFWGIGGDLIELGAWEGKSALFSAAFAGPGETQHIVDYKVRPGLLKNLEALPPDQASRVSLVECKTISPATETLRSESKYRFIHIDAAHDRENVFNDLKGYAPTLAENGVLVLDDWFSYRDPGVTEGAFQFLYTCENDLVPFYIGFNKGYFTTRAAQPRYHQMVRELLLEKMVCLHPNPAIERFEMQVCNYPCLQMRFRP